MNRPKSDTCKTCDSLQVKLAVPGLDEGTNAQLKGELMLHQAKGERGYQALKEDTALAKSDPTVKAITFDLQQTLPTPALSTSVFFYRRQLWTYSLGIHELDTGLGCMHMWSEDIASRGSNEVGSCILKHLNLATKLGIQLPRTATETRHAAPTAVAGSIIL